MGVQRKGGAHNILSHHRHKAFYHYRLFLKHYDNNFRSVKFFFAYHKNFGFFAHFFNKTIRLAEKNIAFNVS